MLLTIADKDLEQINVERAIPDPKPICANRLAKIDTVIPRKTKYWELKLVNVDINMMLTKW